MKRLLLAVMMAWGLVLSPLMAGGAFAQDPPAAEKEEKAPEAEDKGELAPAPEGEAKDEAKDPEAKPEKVEGSAKENPLAAEDRERFKDIKDIGEAGAAGKAAYEAFKDGRVLFGLALIPFLLVFISRASFLKNQFEDKRWWGVVNFVLALLVVPAAAIISADNIGDIDWFAVIEAVGQVVVDAGGIWGVAKIFGLNKLTKPDAEAAKAA